MKKWFLLALLLSFAAQNGFSELDAHQVIQQELNRQEAIDAHTDRVYALAAYFKSLVDLEAPGWRKDPEIVQFVDQQSLIVSKAYFPDSNSLYYPEAHQTIASMIGPSVRAKMAEKQARIDSRKQKAEKMGRAIGNILGWMGNNYIESTQRESQHQRNMQLIQNARPRCYGNASYFSCY